MSRTLKLDIKETAEELKTLLKKENSAQVKEKITALYLLKSGTVTTLEGLSELLVRDQSTIYRWFEKYKSLGLPGLLKLYKPAGRSLSIPPDALEKLAPKLSEPAGFKSYGEIQSWLKSECDVEVDYHAVYRTVRYKLQAKLKEPRPSSTKKDEEEVELFKTNLPNLINLAQTMWSWRCGEFKRVWLQFDVKTSVYIKRQQEIHTGQSCSKTVKRDQCCEKEYVDLAQLLLLPPSTSCQSNINAV